MLIARALASEPEVLVLDEPTAGVDAANQEILAATLASLMQRGATTLVVGSRARSARTPRRPGRGAARRAEDVRRPTDAGSCWRGLAPARRCRSAGPWVVRMTFLSYDFMQRALLAALLVGLAAPSVGVYLVQRRLALIGDGLGHAALTGVALGLLTSTSPVLTALVCAVAGGIIVELVRLRGRHNWRHRSRHPVLRRHCRRCRPRVARRRGNAGATSMPTCSAPSPRRRLPTSSRSRCSPHLRARGRPSVWRRPLFAVSDDEEYARASGLPVVALNLLLAVITAVTVVVSMRVVGLLLDQRADGRPGGDSSADPFRAFAGTMAVAIGIGVVVSAGGVVTSFYVDTPSGGTIVLLAVAVFGVVRQRLAVRHRLRRDAASGARKTTCIAHGPECGHPAVSHEDHVDYVHDGHRHAAARRALRRALRRRR